MRADYSINFKFTDLAKDKNFIGFESGIWCLYPNFMNDKLLMESDDPTEQFNCLDNEFYKEKYLTGGEEPPKYYDPRCRVWYSDQYEKKHSIYSDVYEYANGRLGVTNCVPLWSYNENTYYGAYCLDQYPTSENSDFVSHYYKDKHGGHVDYLVFNPDGNYTAGNFM